MRLLAALIAGLGAATAAAAVGTPAAAAAADCSLLGKCWALYGSVGDVAGADAKGYSTPCDGARVCVFGTLTDTKADSSSACLEIYAEYSDGGTRWEFDYIGGKGKTKGLGTQGHYNFASNVRRIEAREGVGVPGDCTYADNWVVIATKRG